MVYPEDVFKRVWDVFICLTLIFTCLVVPVRIAFSTEDTAFWSFVNYSIDFVFVLDILLTFNVALYDSNMQIIDNRKKIAKIYMKTWFSIDLLAVIPFDLILQASGNSELGHFTKLSRMYKLTKLSRLFRVIKLFKK
mmetsp:Transcript_28158/g.42618  ORF Transcript_28158/g.42618 Transcript_28158/m.42618 type:complete len:137 (+) Transcript_28158:594-1004(+)